MGNRRLWNRLMLQSARDREDRERLWRRIGGIAKKLLLLSIPFLLMAEVLKAIPSTADFGRAWIGDRLRTASAVARVVMDRGPGSLIMRTNSRVLRASAVR